MPKKMSNEKTKIKKKVDVAEVVIASPLDDTTYGTDAGNGSELTIGLQKGKLVVNTEPHGRITATGGSFGADSIVAAAEYDWHDWKGRHYSLEEPARYAKGEGVWNILQRPMETHRNTETRYGDDLHINAIIYGLAKVNAPTDKPLTVVVPLPPGLIHEYEKPVKRALLEGENAARDGKWSIRLKGWKQWKTYTIGRVIVMPEGAPGYAAYAFGLDGQPIRDDYMFDEGSYLLAGHVMVLDLGYGTGDMFSIVDGKITADAIQHASDNKAGIQVHVASKVLAKVQELTGAEHLTEAHVDGWLRRWASSGWSEEAAINLVAGKRVEMYKTLLRVCREYADWLHAEKLSAAWRTGADAVLAVGGGWLYVETPLREKNPKRRILTPSQFPHLKQIPIFALNGYGSLAYLAHYLSKNG